MLSPWSDWQRTGIAGERIRIYVTGHEPTDPARLSLEPLPALWVTDRVAGWLADHAARRMQGRIDPVPRDDPQV